MGITVGKSYDLNAAEFFNATQILTVLQKEAVNTLVTDLKIYNLWDKMKAIYPFVGQAGVSSSFEVNLKDVNTFRGTFTTTGWTFSNTGATPDGINAYMNTGLNANIQLDVNSSHLSYYARNLNTSAGFNVFMGIGSTTCFMQGSNNNVINARQASSANSSLSDTPVGFLIGNKQNSTTQQSYKNNLKETLTVTTTLFSTTLQNIFVGNYNTDGVFGTNSECAFSSIGDGLTDTESANLYTAVQRFQTTLGRQV